MGLLRLLLALAVVADHAGPAFGMQWLRMTNAPLAVQVFYVVSGFYMALVLNEKYAGEGAYAAFAKSRLLRLLPMYGVVLVLSVVGGLLLHSLAGVTIAPLRSWLDHGGALPWGERLCLLLPNLTLVGQDVLSWFAVDPNAHDLYYTAAFHKEPLPAWQFLFVPQAWTVALEISFYALAPLLVRRHVGVVVGLVVASLCLRVWLMTTYAVKDDPWSYRLFPTELALFLAGAFAWHLHGWLRRRGWLTALPCRLVLLATLAVVLGYQFLPHRLYYLRPFGLPVVLALVPLVIPFVFEATRQNRWDRALGELSYPSYLVHYLLLFVVEASGVAWLVANQGALVAGGTLLLAWLLWQTVGKRFELRRQRIGERLSALRPAGHAS